MAFQGLYYAQEYGWHVGPTCWPDDSGRCACSRDHTERDVGKAPLTPNGYHGFSNDPAVLGRLAERYPEANTALNLARSEIVAVDADSEAALAESRANGIPAGTPRTRTGNGGHWLFRRPAGTPLVRAIHTGASGAIDILSDGYVVLPGSQHRTGREYVWEVEPNGPLPEAPAWVVSILEEQYRKQQDAGPLDLTPVVPADNLDPIAGLDAETEAVRAGQVTVTKEDGATDRSETLYRLAIGLAKAGLDVDTIASEVAGYDKRQTKPKYANRRDATKRYRETAQRAAASVHTEGALELGGDDDDDHDGGQVGWVDKYIAKHPGTKFGLGSWRRYDRGAWGEIDELQVRDEVQRLMGTAATARLVKDVADLLKPRVRTRTEEWNQNTELLVFNNLTLDLVSFQAREHRPDDMATERLPYDYDPDATAPAWTRYLQQLHSPAVAAFVQEFCGYTLTADVDQEITLWMVGPPGSGRSTFLEGLQAAHAGLYGTLSFKHLGNRFALANLPGKRLLVSAEQPDGFLDDSDTLNQLISGDAITAEKKYEGSFTFRSTAKMAFAMNKLPRIKDPHNGIVRRAKILRFGTAIQDRDPAVKQAIRNEGAGIMNWAIEGLMRLRQRGRFVIPSEVEEAIKEFRDTNDVAGLFVDELCEKEERTSSRELYRAYDTWCQNNGFRAKNITQVAEDWKRLGFEKVTVNGRSYWRGVRLRHEHQQKVA